jgi:hypothetical protein
VASRARIVAAQRGDGVEEEELTGPDQIWIRTAAAKPIDFFLDAAREPVLAEDFSQGGVKRRARTAGVVELRARTAVGGCTGDLGSHRRLYIVYRASRGYEGGKAKSMKSEGHVTTHGVLQVQ